MPDVKRQAIQDISVHQAIVANESNLDQIASYYSRQTDKDTVQTAMIQAYAIGIGSVQAGETTVETYVHKGFSEEVYSGAIDAITMGWGHKVANAKATLFTEPGSKFSLVHDTIDDVKDVEAMLWKHRNKGGYKTSIISCDKSSVYIGSSSVLTFTRDGSLHYRKVQPGQVRAIFGEWVDETDDNGTTLRRPVNQSNIEDASIVMIRLGAASIHEYSWLAIIPRTESEKYPYGRYVYFTANADAATIPDPGEDGVYDFEMDGQIMNPLSWYADQHPDQNVQEIPLAIMDGGTTDVDNLFPICETIYNMSVSFDKKTSHISDKADDKAAGLKVFTQSNESQGQPAPRSASGTVILFPGQGIEDKGNDASACKTAHEILHDDKIEAAAAFSVPDFMVSSEDYTVEASSGVALAIKAKPLAQDRENRAGLNAPFVNRLFEIEKAYIAFIDEDDEALINVLVECVQLWDPGTLHLPENKKENAERVSMLVERGMIDTIQGIKELYQLQSDAEAIDFYDKMAERKKEYPPLLLEEPKKTVGINRRAIRTDAD